MDENGTALIMHQSLSSSLTSTTTSIATATSSTLTTKSSLPHQQQQHHHHHGTAPPPAYSRLPPDGHEFPPNFCEPADLGALLLSGGVGVGDGVGGGSAVKLNEPETRLYHEKKQLHFIDAANNTTTMKTTTTTAATIATTTNHSNNNNNLNKSLIMTNMFETTTTNDINKLPPPLPKSVPPPPQQQQQHGTTPAPTARKIYREQLVVNIEAANNLEDSKSSTPRRSSSTLSLSSTPASGSSTPTTAEFRPSLRSTRKPSNWHKDEKSERSVRDKIAMFSMDDGSGSGSQNGSMSGSTPHLNITTNSTNANFPNSCSSSRKALNLSSDNLLDASTNSLSFIGCSSSAGFKKPSTAPLKSAQSTSNSSDYFTRSSPSSDIFSTRALSMENLYAAPLSSVSGGSSKSQQQQQTQQQLSKYSESMQSLDTMPSYYASLPRRHHHNLSQSQSQIERRTSFSGGHLTDEASRKVANLLEHRRRSITKLRGLVIPERPSTLEPILDLPEIKSRDSEQTTMSDYSTDSGVGSSGSATTTTTMPPTAPRAAKRLENVAISAPQSTGTSAHYRSIFGATPQRLTLNGGGGGGRSQSSIELMPQPPAKPPRTSLGVVVTTTTSSSSSSALTSPPMRPQALLPHHQHQHQNDESDSDSVFSSKVSSPPMSPLSSTNLSGVSVGASSTISSTSSCSANSSTHNNNNNNAPSNSNVPEKFALTRTLSSETNTSIASSTTSTLTSGSGSQASCSSVGSTPTVDLSRRLLKTTHTISNSSYNNNTDAAAVAAAASRKNILASAKCRSGRGESSLLMRQRNQAPYHDDEDSTDGYDEEVERRVAHKSRSRNNLTNGNALNAHTPATTTNHTTHAAQNLINYKLVSKQMATSHPTTSKHNNHNNTNDRVINVANYVEVTTTTTTTTTTASDTDDSSGHKSDATNTTSPSKISAIFIDEERKASFKAADLAAKPVKTTTVKMMSAAPGVANAKPVKAVLAQQAAAPLSAISSSSSSSTSKSFSTKQLLLSPKTMKSTIQNHHDAVDSSPSSMSTSTSASELQQWMAKSSAKINAAAAASASTFTSTSKKTTTTTNDKQTLKPVLAKFERSGGNSGGSGSIAASIAVILPKAQANHSKHTTSTAELRERFERGSGSSATTTPTTTATKPLHALKTSNISNGSAATSSNYLDRFSSLDSVASSSSGVSSSTQNVSSTHEHNEFGSFSSLGSNQSLITAQDIQQIIEEADPPLKHPEAFIVVLQRDTPETTVGITLAGGANYETKEITVNKILADSPAARDGRLRKGDRILAVNGMSMRGLTHNESVSVLKTPRPEVTLVVTRSESLVVETATTTKKRQTLGSLTSLLEKPSSDTQLVKKESRQTYHSASRSLDIGLDSVVSPNSSNETTTTEVKTTKPRTSTRESNTLNEVSSPSSSSAITTATTTTRRTVSQYQRLNSGELQNKRDETAQPTPAATNSSSSAPQRAVNVCKDNCGLGFSLEGGFDSPLGNRPLLIKKVFYGGAAHRTGQVKPGDEIVAINGLSTAKMTRIEVWNYMNQLPLGDVEMVLV